MPWLRKSNRTKMSEDPRLYDIARQITHDMGFDWTDPRTLKKYPKPKTKNHEHKKKNPNPKRSKKAT
jgi:hypothetical protein